MYLSCCFWYKQWVWAIASPLSDSVFFSLLLLSHSFTFFYAAHCWTIAVKQVANVLSVCIMHTLSRYFRCSQLTEWRRWLRLTRVEREADTRGNQFIKQLSKTHQHWNLVENEPHHVQTIPFASPNPCFRQYVQLRMGFQPVVVHAHLTVATKLNISKY